MRALTPLLTACSLLLLLLVIGLWARSYFRYDGMLHFTEGASAMATASRNGKSADAEVTGRSSGLISYRGRLTYVSIANPLRPQPWESWSIPADAPPSSGPMMLTWEARARTGVAWGSAKTVNELRDPFVGISWRLPYSFLTLPYWVPTVLLGILPYGWVMRRRQAAKWRAQGRCAACGEKLKGATACPACGAASPSPSPASIEG
jgi:hypothetical protein